jgi:hypothetical protein
MVLHFPTLKNFFFLNEFVAYMNDVQNTRDGEMVKIKCTFNCLSIYMYCIQSCNKAVSHVLRLNLPVGSCYNLTSLFVYTEV